MKTFWNNPTDWVAQDSALRIAYPSVEHPAAEITSTAPGGPRWVFVPLRLPNGGPLKAIRLCYQLSDSSSFITRVRLIELLTPSPALVRHDDPANLLSTVPACHIIETAPFLPQGALTLALRLQFSSAAHTVRLGPLGLDVETCAIEVADVRCFGALGDGDADDTLPIQAAIDAVGDSGGVVYFPPGTYCTSEPLIVDRDGVALRGAGYYATVVQNASSDVLHVSSNRLIRRFVLEDIHLESKPGGGHVILVPAGMGQSTIRSARLVQRNDAMSIFRLVLTGDGDGEGGDGDDVDLDKVAAGGYNNLVAETWLQGPENPTVPQWYVQVEGTRYNSNVFERVRCDRSGDFFFHLEATSAALAGNTFRDIVFEACSGGKFRLLSCQNTLLQECVAYDNLKFADAFTRDGYYLGKSEHGALSIYNTFLNCDRRSGSLSGDFKDIRLAPGECQATTVINCGGRQGAGITHDFGDTTVTAIGMSVFVTFEGTDQTTRVP